MDLKSRVFIFFVCALAFASCNKDKSPYPYQFFENQVIKEINEYRVSIGLEELATHDKITEEARNHSKNMARKVVPFGHDGFHGRINILKESIPGINQSAENVSYGYDNAKAVVAAWLQSEGHKNNIEGDYTHMGVGIAVDKDDVHYFTQIFIGVEK